MLYSELRLRVHLAMKLGGKGSGILLALFELGNLNR